MSNEDDDLSLIVSLFVAVLGSNAAIMAILTRISDDATIEVINHNVGEIKEINRKCREFIERRKGKQDE